MRLAITILLATIAAACGHDASGATPQPSPPAATAPTRTPTTSLPAAQLHDAFARVEPLARQPYPVRVAAAASGLGPPQQSTSVAGASVSSWWSWGAGVNGPCLELSITESAGDHLGPTDPSKCGM